MIATIKMYEVYEKDSRGHDFLLLVTSDGVHARQVAQVGDSIAECLYTRIEPDERNPHGTRQS